MCILTQRRSGQILALGLAFVWPTLAYHLTEKEVGQEKLRGDWVLEVCTCVGVGGDMKRGVVPSAFTQRAPASFVTWCGRIIFFGATGRISHA